MYSQDRNQIRTFFRSAWKKYIDKLPAEPLEILVGDVISIHPEYHNMLENDSNDLDKDYQPEEGQTNPFLHMGMHISLREQYNSNRPDGIQLLYKKILIKMGDPHEAEHVMMDCLAENLWQAQKSGELPDEKAYLDCLKQIINRF